ncbi:hypothetical protein M885DRAFT_548080 [Pelagophyceae sp. CCMP2097]|nr:hypothetical protein M885DRAFT_548080 [Pelagophyceae sp. CCMP2097]
MDEHRSSNSAAQPRWSACFAPSPPFASSVAVAAGASAGSGTGVATCGMLGRRVTCGMLGRRAATPSFLTFDPLGFATRAAAGGASTSAACATGRATCGAAAGAAGAAGAASAGATGPLSARATAAAFFAAPGAFSRFELGRAAARAPSPPAGAPAGAAPAAGAASPPGGKRRSATARACLAGEHCDSAATLAAMVSRAHATSISSSDASMPARKGERAQPRAKGAPRAVRFEKAR